MGAPLGSFRGNQYATGPAEWIEDHAAGFGAVANRICDHVHWLNFGTRRILTFRGTVQGDLTGIVPHVRSLSPIAPNRYIVDVGIVANLEHEDEFVRRVIEQARTGLTFGPNAEVLGLAVDLLGGDDHLLHVLPIHTDEMNGAAGRVGRGMAEKCFEEARLGRGQFA